MSSFRKASKADWTLLAGSGRLMNNRPVESGLLLSRVLLEYIEFDNGLQRVLSTNMGRYVNCPWLGKTSLYTPQMVFSLKINLPNPANGNDCPHYNNLNPKPQPLNPWVYSWLRVYQEGDGMNQQPPGPRTNQNPQAQFSLNPICTIL